MRNIAIILLFSLSVFACSNKAGKQSLAAVEFQHELTAQPMAQILDVRTSDEYSNGHIEGAILADISSDLFQDAVAKLDKSKTVFVYCLSGGRSASAAAQLQEMGFTSVIDLSGGMLAWRSANLPVSTQAGPANKPDGMTIADFEKQLVGKKLVIVDYNATWCGPCKQLSPVLEAWVKSQKGQVVLLKIDVDENQALAKAKQIESIPYLEFYKDGKLADKQIGMGEAKAMTEKWRQIML